jgi:hypothetical protein
VRLEQLKSEATTYSMGIKVKEISGLQSIIKKLTQKKNFNTVFLLTTIVFGAFSVFLGYVNVTLVETNNELAQANLRVQLLVFNYTPRVFAYSPTGELVVYLGQSPPNGKLVLTVVVISPHNGYATINETGFRADNSSEYLDKHALKRDDIKLSGRYILAVQEGSFEKNVDLYFWSIIFLNNTYLTIRNIIGADFYVGSLELTIIFHDIQLGQYYLGKVEIPVRAKF